MPSWNPTRTKVQLKLAVERMKMLQTKQEAIAKKDRKEIANLIERHKEETARIKTEGIIAEDIHIELLEILELYCETILARFALLDLPGRDPEPSLSEPVAAIIHCAPRVDMREIHILRDMLISRYREFAQDAIENKDNIIGARVASRLKISTPSPELVDLYVSEICKAYDVPFSSPYIVDKSALQSEATEDPGASDTADSSTKDKAIPDPNPEANIPPAAAAETHSDAQVSKAIGNTVPKGSSTGDKKGGDSNESGPNKTLHSKQQSEKAAYDDLEARFAALKKR